MCHQAARAGHQRFRKRAHGGKIECRGRSHQSEGGSAEPLLADVTDVKQVNAALQKVVDSAGRLSSPFYNAGNNRPEAFLDVTPEIYEEMWRVICFGACCFATVRLMLTQKDIAERQSLFFTGASGSLRGKANFSAFASGKGALRSSPNPSRASLARKTFTSRMWLLTGLSMAKKSARAFPNF